MKLKPKKSLGQNFLKDKNIIKKIIKLEEISKNTSILEIGPGTGNLTAELLMLNPKKITLVEKDVHLSNFLKKKFKKFKNLEVLNKDILEVNYKNFFSNNLIIYGNLPYNISVKILTELIMLKKWPPFYKKLIFMFQKEVGDRICAAYGSKDYGRLSIMSHWRLNVKKNFEVSNNSFYPKPKVKSVVLTFKPKNNLYKFNNPKSLETITRVFFSNKRKMINKAYKKIFKKDYSIKSRLNINLNLRPENLTFHDYYKLSEEFEKI